MKKVGVIGAGVMGRGVAQNLAAKGMKTILVDVSDEILESSREEIYNALRFQKMVEGRALEVDLEQAIASIEFVTDYDSLVDADFVIENVVEDFETKRGIYKKIDFVCDESVVFAANTSAISITRIGGETNRPENIVGMHFMNPVPMKSLVEVIRGYHTSSDSIDRAKDLLDIMGKRGVVVNDSPGFVSNRVLMLMINEAIFLLRDQVASPAEVDEIFRDCFGHKMGPLETADLIGLDTILLSIEVLYESFCEDKYRPCPLLKKLVAAGLLGRKSGEGFFKY